MPGRVAAAGRTGRPGAPVAVAWWSGPVIRTGPGAPGAVPGPGRPAARPARAPGVAARRPPPRTHGVGPGRGYRSCPAGRATRAVREGGGWRGPNGSLAGGHLDAARARLGPDPVR